MFASRARLASSHTVGGSADDVLNCMTAFERDACAIVWMHIVSQAA